MMKLRRGLAVAIACVLLATIVSIVQPQAASAAAPVGIIVNGLKVSFNGIQPYVDGEGRTMVPLRPIAAALGAELSWQPNGRMQLTAGSMSVGMRLNQTKVVVNGKLLELDAAPISLEGQTVVPLRLLSQGLGAKVRWDSEANAVHVTGASVDPAELALDAWGRQIRTAGLPGRASDWAYVLADVPNGAYNMGYRQRLNPNGVRTLTSEALQDPNFSRENLDLWADRIRDYYALVFGVDYRTIDPSAWWEDFRPVMNNSSLDSMTRVRYAEWVQANRIRLEGWAEPEPSLVYRQDGQVMMRTKVRFRIVESDTNYGVLLDTFESSYEMYLKQGVWYSGYADIALSTNAAGDPWPHYGVEGHDHLFFTPNGGIQEEVGELS